MESFGSFLDEEWESLSKMFSENQDSDHFSSHGFNFETSSNVSYVMTESNNANSSFTDDHENIINPNFYQYFSQETSNNGGCVVYDPNYPSSNGIPLPTNGVCDIYDHENNSNSTLLSQLVLSDFLMEEILGLRQDVNMENSVDPHMPNADELEHTPLETKIEISGSQDALEDKVNDEKPIEKPKKRTRVSKDNKNKKKVQPKKKQKVTDSTENGNDIDGENKKNKKIENTPIASSSSCSSEDDLNGGAENSNWKTRASRGAATDPQSLYARKRRERINERLKVLQNLVPNGTKVDISTMLEEAVQYVKFLQLQIKLLSSDEMWMYAPIAYNGMDMGLYQKLSHS